MSSRTSETTKRAPPSRLGDMQMRFQQKQLQERELRRLRLTEDYPDSSEPDVDNGFNAASKLGKDLGNGKVRQMFHERRRTGVDRSNPLRPIVSGYELPPTTSGSRNSSIRTKPLANESQSQVKNVAKGNRPLKSNQMNSSQSQMFDRNMMQSQQRRYNDDEIISKQMTSLSLDERKYKRDDNTITNGSTLNYNVQTKFNSNKPQKFDAATSMGLHPKMTGNLRLNPVVTKKAPQSITFVTPGHSKIYSHVEVRKNPVTFAKTPHASHKTTNMSNVSSTVSNFKNQYDSDVSINVANKKYFLLQKENKDAAATPSGMGTCRYCHRHFITERLPKHEQVCVKVSNSKRKVYDAAKHRVEGTEAEQFTKKISRAGMRNGPSYTTAYAGPNSVIQSNNAALRRNNWRKKHEELITAIRAAKQVKQHLARGGKLSDLPPPPPAENPDYIQCPHCLRRFNEAAAERHIPKCANMIHNKPKPGPNNKKRN